LGCDIVLSNISVSRHHCHVSIASGALFVRDLGSQQGTYVNGRRVGRGGRYLQAGDRLEAADVALIALEVRPSLLSSASVAPRAAALPKRGRGLKDLPDLSALLRPEDESFSVRRVGFRGRPFEPVFRPESSARSPLELRQSDIPNLAAQLRPGDESASVLRFCRAPNGHAMIEAILRSSIPPRDLGRRISELPHLAELFQSTASDVELESAWPPADEEPAPNGSAHPEATVSK
jgi:predicted component of type VI protein secretion system